MFGEELLRNCPDPTISKTRGMTQIARDAGMGRESLYKAFAPGAKPRFDTVLKVIHALGIDLQALPTQGEKPKAS
ncbi:putative addiction module antidote protein [Pseudomonas sp. NFXW11]